MKLQQDRSNHLIVTAYGDDYVDINRERHETGLILLPERIITPWCAGGFAALTDADMQQLADLSVDVVLIGTGMQQRFPTPSLLRSLIEAQRGYEVMNLAAACRTYNVLAGEGRNVAVALMLN